MMTAEDRASYDLALTIKLDLLERHPQPDYVLVVLACCWLLADAITQAEAAGGESVEQATALIFTKLLHSVEALKLANAEADADAAATKH